MTKDEQKLRKFIKNILKDLRLTLINENYEYGKNLQSFLIEIQKLKDGEYAQTIIGFSPIVTIEAKGANYLLSIWNHRNDIFLEDPLFRATFSLMSADANFDYIKKFLRGKTIEDLISNLTHIGKRRF